MTIMLSYKLDILNSEYDFRCCKILITILQSNLNPLNRQVKLLSIPTEEDATMVLEVCFDYMYITMA